ncbi:MAG: lysine--tRNA ligase, partial [Candidatus Micrarchaeaceae archaeon]
GKEVSIAGRIMGIRKSGKLLFVDILDKTGKIQGYFDYSLIGEEEFKNVKKFNIGDIIGVNGEVFKTNPGEISIKAKKVSLLAKALRSLPEKWKGLQDIEIRYRKRYLDLIVNQKARDIITKRTKIINHIREYLNNKNFLEVETPVIQPLYGGADAEPFKTFVNTLNEEDYLRISNELYLKRLIIGGMERVYEIYKAFRNEDIDSTHSPEFTMLEAYQAYTDYEGMMKLTEELFKYIAEKLSITNLTYQGNKLNILAPFNRVKYVDAINEEVGQDILSLDDEALFNLAEKEGIKFEKGKRFRAHAYDKLFEKIVQPKLIQPTFAIDFPAETSPLTRPKRGNNKLVERFEFYINGLEIANAYSELNNPIIQRRNFEKEQEKAKAGDKEAEPLDMDFVEAMEYGMPPTGGIGIGIDRLVMIFTDQVSIKEVIPFPMEKRYS